MSEAFKCNICGTYSDNVRQRYHVSIDSIDPLDHLTRPDVSEKKEDFPDIYHFDETDVCQDCVANLIWTIRTRCGTE